MFINDMAFLPSRSCLSSAFHENCGRGESHKNTKCRQAVFGVSKGILLVKYFCSNKVSLCQSNFMQIIRLLQRLGKSDHPNFLRILPDLE